MNAFATDNEQIIEGLKRSSASMAIMGEDLESNIALFTAAQEILQDEASVGTALRSLSLRVKGFDEETGELSEDLTNITGKIVDLTKTAKNAKGVSIFTDETQTEYKSLVDYFRDLRDVWDDMSEQNQNALLKDLFGMRGAKFLCPHVQKCA